MSHGSQLSKRRHMNKQSAGEKIRNLTGVREPPSPSRVIPMSNDEHKFDPNALSGQHQHHIVVGEIGLSPVLHHLF